MLPDRLWEASATPAVGVGKVAPDIGFRKERDLEEGPQGWGIAGLFSNADQRPPRGTGYFLNIFSTAVLICVTSFPLLSLRLSRAIPRHASFF